MEPRTGEPPLRGRTRHDRHVQANGRRRHQGLLDHLHESGCHRGEPQHGDHRAGDRRAGDHPGRLPLHGHQPVRRHRPARHPVGRDRCGDGELRPQPHPAAAVDSAGRAGAPRLAADLSGRRAPRVRGRLHLCLECRSVRGDRRILQPENGLRPARCHVRAAEGDPGAVARAPSRSAGRGRGPPPRCAT